MGPCCEQPAPSDREPPSSLHAQLHAHGTLNLETAMASEATDAAKILTTAPEHKRAGAADANVGFAG